MRLTDDEHELLQIFYAEAQGQAEKATAADEAGALECSHEAALTSRAQRP